MKRPRTLSAQFVKAVNQTGRYGDGHGSRGLSLVVTRYQNGRLGKRWQQRIAIDGRRTTISLGPYPEITLSEARQMAFANSRKIAHGRDPRRPGIPTFEDAAKAYIDRMAPGWVIGTTRDWHRTMSTHIYPKIGGHRVDHIQIVDVLEVLLPHWLPQPVLGQTLRRMMSAVLEEATARGWRPDNPAGPAVKRMLPQQNHTTNHREAVPVDNAPSSYRALVEDVKAKPVTRQAAMWLALTATRSNEARGARWDEIDLDGEIPTWTIPATRRKSRTGLQVPLAGAAVKLLVEIRGSTRKPTGYLFPGLRGKPVSGEAVRILNKRAAGATAHGWRSTFRSWCAESGQDRDLAEMSLGHAVGSRVEQAYQRSDLLDLRLPVMEAWAKYLTDG